MAAVHSQVRSNGISGLRITYVLSQSQRLEREFQKEASQQESFIIQRKLQQYKINMKKRFFQRKVAGVWKYGGHIMRIPYEY